MQLDNVNNNYRLPVDVETHKELETDIAKTLVPLLQSWLYARREQKGVWKDAMTSLCQLLGIPNTGTRPKS